MSDLLLFQELPFRLFDSLLDSSLHFSDHQVVEVLGLLLDVLIRVLMRTLQIHHLDSLLVGHIIRTKHRLVVFKSLKDC